MYECPCGFICGSPDALRLHRQTCMVPRPEPKKEPEPDYCIDYGADKWDNYLLGGGLDD